MGPDPIRERIAHARQCVQSVLQNWNGADLAQGDLCRARLEDAVTDVRAIEGHLQARIAGVPDDRRSSLLDLKQEIAQIVRVVDAGLAFYRGVALRMGDSSPSYGPGGSLAEEASSTPLRGMQV
jgi:hypothetical protein